MNLHSYADDVQLYNAVSPDDPWPIDSLLNCSLNIELRMADDFLQLNLDQTKILGHWCWIENVAGRALSASEKPTVDSEFSVKSHINNITESGFYLIFRRTNQYKDATPCSYYLQGQLSATTAS